MKCKHCGEEIADDSKFCEFCGTKVKKRVPWWGILLIALASLSFIVWGALNLSYYYICNPSYDNGNSEETMEEQGSIEVVEVEESTASIEEKPKPVAEKNEIEEMVGSAKGAVTLDSKQEKPVKQVPAGYVDLGLTVYWKSSNESGYYYYDDAVERFGKKLPTVSQWEDLKCRCTWTWTGSGYRITGPNGNFIYLPAAGCRYWEESINDLGNVDDKGVVGSYASVPFSPSGYFDFTSSEINEVGLNCLEVSVRLVQGK